MDNILFCAALFISAGVATYVALVMYALYTADKESIKDFKKDSTSEENKYVNARENEEN